MPVNPPDRTRGRAQDETADVVVEEAQHAFDLMAELQASLDRVRRGAIQQRTIGARFAVEIQLLVGEDELDTDTIRRAARLAVADRAWQRRIGELFETRDVVTTLGVSRQRVGRLASEHRLVALPTESGALRYPAWQFAITEGQRRVAADAHQTLVADGHLSPWTAASWLLSPHPDLSGRHPVAAITDGDLGAVLSAAAHDAARAAQ